MDESQGRKPDPKEDLWDEGMRAALESEAAGAPPRSVAAIIEHLHQVTPKVHLHDNLEPDPAILAAPAREGNGAIRDGSRYEFLGEIARGGVGVVYKGRDRDLGRDVAVKVLRPDHAGSADLVERFVEEAQIGGQLQHPGVVPVFGLEVQPDGRPYFAMKLVVGRTLAACLEERESPTHDRRRFLRIFEQICQTVAYAHTRGVVHRDLKPLNVMVGSFGEVQVVDWGLAKVLGRETDADLGSREPEELRTVRSGSSSAGSQQGSVMGTPAYMPPEQALGKVDQQDKRADVFTLGGILLELLTGRPPFSLEPRKALAQAARGDLADAYAALDACGEEEPLTQLCRACLSAERAARPRDAGVVAAQVTRYLAAAEDRARQAELEAVEARVRADEERKARRLTVALAATVLLAVVLGGGGYLWFVGERRARQDRAASAVASAMEESRERLGQAREAAVLDLGPWTAACDAANRAVELARTGGAAEDVIERARGNRAEVEAEFLVARTAAEQKARDDAQVARMQKLRLDRFDAPDLRRTHRIYVEAFRGYGVDVEGLPPSQSAALIAGSGIANDLVSALDEWVWIRTRIGGRKDPAADRLHIIVQAADGNLERTRIRNLAREDSVDQLLTLAQSGPLDRETAWLLARALGSRGEHKAAVELLRLAQRREPDAFWVNYQLARELARLGQWAESATFFRVAVSERAASVTVLHELGAALLQAGEADEALNVWREALRLDPGDVQAYHLILDTCKTRGELDEAIGQLRQEIRRSSEDPRPRLGLALAMMAKGAWPAVIEILEEAVAIPPDDASMRTHLGDAYRYRRRHEEALSEYERALRLDPGCIPATVGIYAIRRAEGEHVEAEALAREIIAFDPSVALSYGKLGQSLYDQGRFPEAAQAFRDGIEREEDQPILHHELARCHLCTGELDEAIRELLTSHDYAKLYWARSFATAERLEVDPVSGVRRHFLQFGFGMLEELIDSRLATAYVRKGDFASACDRLRAHLKRHVDCPGSRFFLGLLLMLTGDPAPAIPELRKVVEQESPQDLFAVAYAHYYLGFALLATGQFEEGRRHLLQYGTCMVRDPDWQPPPAVWEQDCEAFASLARRLPELLADRSGIDSPRRRFLLGWLLESTGWQVAAAECYREAFEMDPDLKAFKIDADFPYNGVMGAAHSALKAGWGVGKDASSLTDAARAHWRRQSLVWMQEDLALWRERVRTGKPVERKWLKLYLAGLRLGERSTQVSLARDAANLRLLPEDERKAWEAFWSEADALLKQLEDG